MARDGLGQENIPIRITNLSLTVDDMNEGPFSRWAGVFSASSTGMERL